MGPGMAAKQPGRLLLIQAAHVVVVASQVALVEKNLPANAEGKGDLSSNGFESWVWKTPWRRA